LRILFLSEVLPYPLDSGPKIRIYYVLKQLSARHRVSLLSFIRSAKELQHVPHLLGFCEDARTIPIKRSRLKDAFYLLLSFLSNRPFIILRDYVSEMRSAVETLVDTGGFDVVHADQLVMAQYAENLSGVKKVLDEHNAVWTIVERLYAGEQNGLKRAVLRRECENLKRYEASVCHKFDQVLAVTEADRELLQSLTSNDCNIEVIPICTDPSAIPVVERAPGTKRILYVGLMYWQPNVDGVLWFSKEVYPLIKREVQDAAFYIVGARPPRAVKGLARTPLDIVVTGYVEDLLPYWRDCAVFVVPLRAGGGMRVKIIEALSRGVPVVSTSVGCEGIDAQNGEHLLVADEPREFAEAVVEIVRNDELAARLGRNGRRLVEEKYDWKIVYKKLTEVYDRIGSAIVTR
jgi:glycosyltransferase involved in cell wall biosynthesis